ncbi:stage IV sporulation protein A [Fusibacillus kribbianus]|uniref:Stage IV sporulation protein A n=1 Tax=Fusibacillus kribbianus TaxID=3044208 RepID=A0AAP4EXI2_9FIRM|nr:stage IV sporulation protein A [Ruminococcus sp. YH-rum2234]MDI9242574.1 stage IV sporulation protein A [Ruminococcus sp. YH-rum2234]
MDNFHVYKDIQARTGGEIYIGVVGPVRTGKSTFIKRFMDLLVLPGMTDSHEKSRAQDELPQSAAGKTIMTTEPKFIPKEAAEIKVGDAQVKVRLIDCVGFMVEGASGHVENDEERLVKTPWFDYEIPFTQAAALGTEKVIREHSTIGIVITTDGSFGEIPRNAYIEAEKQTIEELKKIGKPFIMLLNTSRPYSDEAKELAGKLKEEYGVQVLPVNCEQLKKDDITRILGEVLNEFPVTELDFYMPKWAEILPASHPLKEKIIAIVRGLMESVLHMRDIRQEYEQEETSPVKGIRLRKADYSDGTAAMDVAVDETVYYQILSDYTGLEIGGEYQLMGILKQFAKTKGEYEKLKNALEAVRQKGYGVIMPERSEILLDDPEVIKHGNKYGVKIHAQAPSINLIRASLETELAPIVGDEKQAEDLIAYIKKNSRDNEDGVWNTSIFGKSIEQIVTDGMEAKIAQLTESCQQKLQDTLQKIINDGNGGMICIII